MNAKLSSLLTSAVLLGAFVGLTGCAGGLGRSVVVADVPANEVADVPVEIEGYPHVYFRGAFAYYVDGRWLYRTPTGYVAFRTEPAELARYHAGGRTTALVVR